MSEPEKPALSLEENFINIFEKAEKEEEKKPESKPLRELRP